MDKNMERWPQAVVLGAPLSAVEDEKNAMASQGVMKSASINLRVPQPERRTVRLACATIRPSWRFRRSAFATSESRTTQS